MNPIRHAKNMIKIASFVKTGYDVYQVGKTVYKGYTAYKSIKQNPMIETASQLKDHLKNQINDKFIGKINTQVLSNPVEAPELSKTEKIEQVRKKLHSK